MTTATRPHEPTPPTGTRKLSEVTKHLVYPAGIAGSDWLTLRHVLNTRLGVVFDGWQDGAAQLALARAEDGRLAATVGGVGMSIPRQVGKTYLFTGLLFTLCLEHPGLLVLWTSHHAVTTNETFLVMQGFAERPEVAPHIKRVYLGSGTEEVRFRNGSRIVFGARERGFGRGIPGVDILVFDEAQILSERALQNMLASMNRSSFGLHCYVGTPPKPTDNSEAFTRMRTEALSGEATDLVWIECGADDDCDLDDVAQWAQANASFPEHTPEHAIKRLRKKLDADGFRREALGIWPASAWAVFDVARWVTLEDATVPAPRRAVLVVDVSPYRSGACIGVAGDAPDGRTVVMVQCGEGIGWVAKQVANLVASHDIAEVALTHGEARGLAGDLTRADVEFKRLAAHDIAASCTAFQAAVSDGTVVHVGQQELDVAVANARTRRAGDAETWDRDFAVDVSALVAAAGAFHRWGLQEAPLPAIY